MDYNTILFEVEDRVLTVTLNRPEKLNACSLEMAAELSDAFRRADEDDEIRVVIVTGAGRGFCAGADISAGSGSFDTSDGETASLAPQDDRRTNHIAMRVFNCRKPSIAAFNGAAVGLGITMALPMDIKIASSSAKFGFVFTRRGLVPEAGSSWFLTRLVGIGQALRWCTSGALFGADEALNGGLISEVVEPEDLMLRAREIASEIAMETAPVSMALTRQMLWRVGAQPHPFAALDLDLALNLELGSTPDVKEAMSAFAEKRKPSFSARPSTDMPPSYPWFEE